MAALSDIDLEKILGPDFRNLLQSQKSENVDVNEQRSIAARIGVLEDRTFSTQVLLIVGVVLAISAWYTAVGITFPIQMAFAVLFVAVGVAAWWSVQTQIATLRARALVLSGRAAA